MGDRVVGRRTRSARLGADVRRQSPRLASQPRHFRGAAALCACRRSTAPRTRRAQRLWTLEYPGPGVDAGGVWLAACAIRDRAIPGRNRAPRAVGRVVMPEPRTSDPHVLDQPWRIWASVAVIGILLFGVLLGIVVISIVQGRSAGLDAYTAICRALGILPGSPAQPQPATAAPPTPVSQVVWTPDVLQILARGNTERGRAKVLEVCVACHGEQGTSTTPA